MTSTSTALVLALQRGSLEKNTAQHVYKLSVTSHMLETRQRRFVVPPNQSRTLDALSKIKRCICKHNMPSITNLNRLLDLTDWSLIGTAAFPRRKLDLVTLSRLKRTVGTVTLRKSDRMCRGTRNTSRFGRAGALSSPAMWFAFNSKLCELELRKEHAEGSRTHYLAGSGTHCGNCKGLLLVKNKVGLQLLPRQIQICRDILRGLA
jgi:hypothetical protein